MPAARSKLWERVYAGVRQGIDQQEEGYRPGEQLPTEHALAEQYGVSRDTVRTALTRLEAEGHVTESHGPTGRTVREYAPLYWHLSRFELGERRDDPETGTDEWAADMREQGRVPRQIVSVEKLLAPPRVAGYLDVEPRSWLVRRRRLRLADDVPVSIADTWLPEDYAELPYTHGDQVLYPFLEERDIALPNGIIASLGIRQHIRSDCIYVRQPDTEEARLLGISTTSSPVGEHVRIGVDLDTDRVLRALITVFPGHLMSLRYEFPTPKE